MQRLVSIDALRALAIVFMVLCHAVIYLSAPESGPWIHFFGNHVVGDFAAPLFAFVMGMSQAISVQSRIDAGLDEKKGVRRTIRRGLAVFGIGLLFALLAWGPAGVWGWDILPFLGMATIILCWVRNWNDPTLISLCFLFAGYAPLCRRFSNFAGAWGGNFEDAAGIGEVAPGILFDPSEDYDPQEGVYEAVQGFFFEGEFPLLPWMVFPLVGYILGRRQFSQKKSSPIGWIALILLTLSPISAGLSSLTPGAEINALLVTPLSFYPNTTSMVMLQLAFCLLALKTLSRWSGEGRVRVVKAIQLISRYSLTIYVLHHFLLLWPIHATDLYANAVSSQTGLIIGIILLFTLYWLVRQWDRQGGRYSLEWFLARLTDGRDRQQVSQQPTPQRP